MQIWHKGLRDVPWAEPPGYAGAKAACAAWDEQPPNARM